MRAQTFHKCAFKKRVRREALVTLAPVAQLERAMDFESVGCVFKSRQARANFTRFRWLSDCEIITGRNLHRNTQVNHHPVFMKLTDLPCAVCFVHSSTQASEVLS
jgi:hypothetical protein